jgi:tetratricopeptide (TPR) repeat protein
MTAHKDGSVHALENRLNNNPVSLVFSRLADCYRKRGDIQEAIDVCSRGLANHPDSTTGRIILGRCYLEQEKLKEAMQEFTNVLQYDRRNQVAVKMLADVYARQGMKDKAGDLYSYVFAMDPDNESLSNLTRTFQGTGKTNIYEILGFAVSSPVDPSNDGQNIFTGESLPARDVSNDAAFARTMQFDVEELTASGESLDVGSFAQTMKYDPEQLRPAASQEYEVEEVVSDITQGAGGSVTGDDISERMSLMFEEEGPPAAEEIQAMEEEPISTPEPSIAQTPSSDSFDSMTMPGPVPEVSGNDISLRIDQLFSEKPETAEVPTEDYTRMFDVRASVARPSMEPTAEPEILRQSSSPAEGNAGSHVSGEDVVSRMAEMFERPDTDVSEIDGDMDVVADEIAAVLEDTPEVPALATLAEPGIMAADETISGDDIAQRLETIFDEEPVVFQSPVDSPDNAMAELASSEFPGDDKIAAATVIQEQAPNETFSVEFPRPLAMEETGADIVLEEAEETFLAASAAPPLDDTVPPEDTPEMSGNDVLNRLDELFPESLLTGDSLSKVDDIPEGEKDEETVNQGFYTMSGDNAETAQSEDAFLEKLDDVEFEAPRTSMPIGDGDHTEDIFADGLKSSEVEDGGGLVAEYAIPDHVLTPTLADIYFQQGQPRLAVQIYERLLRKDPDNERIARRIDEIKKYVALNPEQPAEMEKKPAKKSVSRRASLRGGRSSATPKPLAGVRIKKSPKKKTNNG